MSMSSLRNATPRLSVMLYKTIGRETIDGQRAVSVRYKGKSESIDLTPYLDDGSVVRTSKSVREPAGAFSITIFDKPQSVQAPVSVSASGLSVYLESIYGLIEPMDMVEIRMWNGLGAVPTPYPIIMRGFVTSASRSEAMGDNGQPIRQVTITGHDYGKIWQMYQVIYLASYAEGVPLLTSLAFSELFGVGAQNITTSAELVRTVIDQVINPHIRGMLPKSSSMPATIQTSDKTVLVKHGVVSIAYQEMEGSIYDILKYFCDVGAWNELYLEDREDGVHCVYRPIPALHISTPAEAKNRKIQDDAPDPVYVTIPDNDIQSIEVTRSDADVANFYWVNNQKYDLIDDMSRKLASIPAGDGSVSTGKYANSSVSFYGVRAMRAETQQSNEDIVYVGSGLDEKGQRIRTVKQENWIDRRRRQLMEINRDNIVFEKGTARIKGGPVRDDGQPMKAGDYASFQRGNITFGAYVVAIEHEFRPFQSYLTTLTFERGEGFIERVSVENGSASPWLVEQSTRKGIFS